MKKRFLVVNFEGKFITLETKRSNKSLNKSGIYVMEEADSKEEAQQKADKRNGKAVEFESEVF